MSDEDILARLKETSYEQLFLQGHATTLLANPGAEAELATVTAAGSVEPKLRVLAHELLLEAGQQARPELAEAYCQTLPVGFAHNWWGMPGQYLARLGRTMVGFGGAAIPCLARLLADRRPLSYFGSEEPTMNREMQYRVCDLAAYLIAQISDTPYKDAKQAGLRDEFIADLRRSLDG